MNPSCPSFKWSDNYTTIFETNEIVGSEKSELLYPYDVLVDENNTVYVADTFHNRVIRFSSGRDVMRCLTNSIEILFEGMINETSNTNFTVIMDRTSSDNFKPTALFLTQDHTLFVVDSSNFRVQKWNYDEPLGCTVAGGQGLGETLDKISLSFSLYVDNEHNVYVSECGNHRVTLWMNNNSRNSRIVCRVHLG